MLKKILILAILAGAGFVGYLLWTEYLSEGDKVVMQDKLERVGDKVTSGAKQLAQGAADKLKDVIHGEPEGEENKASSREKPAPPLEKPSGPLAPPH